MRSLFQTRFPRFYRKRSGDRDVSARATHLKAAVENVFMTTTERKRMSTKTTFKRIALVAVAALGFGVLSVVPSQATFTDEALTATASATSIATGDSVTVTVTNTWISSGTSDSRVIGVDSSTTGTGAIQKIYAKTTNDTVNALISNQAIGVAYQLSGASPIVSDTAVPAAGPARQNRVVTTLLLQNFSKAGTYYVTVFSSNAYAGYANQSAVKSVQLTITVADATPTGANVYVSSDTPTGLAARLSYGATPADSAITASAGTAAAPTFVGYMWPVVTITGSYAGDSLTATGANFCSTQAANSALSVAAGYCAVSVSVSGPGLITTGTLAGTKAKSATMSISNAAALTTSDTLVVFSDGTAGTGTITFTMGAVTLATKTVTFYGTASTITPYFVDTIVSVSTSAQVAVKALVKDSGGNKLTSGTIYAYSSDTKIISDSATACTYSTTYAMHSCSLTFVDTGTATITLRDASGVTASTIASTALSFTVRGASVAKVTASFDKATYAPGEKAILTVVTKDLAGNFMDNATVNAAYTISTNRDMGSSSNSNTTSTPLLTTDGVETRVVYMPVTAGVFEYKFTAGTGSVAEKNGGYTSVTASATVVDPTKDAADAATDAALEATDAAYAAQDAAQLAAEAADAATAAAEAATAAVEDLQNKINELTALVQKQITNLAAVVAKIAKKVKA